MPPSIGSAAKPSLRAIRVAGVTGSVTAPEVSLGRRRRPRVLMGSLYGYEIDSDVPLLRLSEVPGELGRVTVRVAKDHPLDDPAEVMRLVPDADGHPRYVAARLGGRILAWHADAGSFTIDREAMLIGHRSTDSVLASGAERWEDRLAS